MCLSRRVAADVRSGEVVRSDVGVEPLPRVDRPSPLSWRDGPDSLELDVRPALALRVRACFLRWEDRADSEEEPSEVEELSSALSPSSTSSPLGRCLRAGFFVLSCRTFCARALAMTFRGFFLAVVGEGLVFVVVFTR